MEIDQIKPEVTLCRLALVATSVHLWESPFIKDLIRKYFLNDRDFIENVGNWHQITDKVLDLLPLFPQQPPLNVMINLEDTVISLGEKIYKWNQYVYKRLKLDTLYAEKIYWTPLGRIDEDKIFKLYWQENTSLYIANADADDVPIFRLACIFAQEEFVYKHRKEMVQEMKRFKNKANEFNVRLEVLDCDDANIVHGIISTQLGYFVSSINESGEEDNLTEQGIPIEYIVNLVVTQYNGEFLTSIMMYQLCFAAGFNQAANYFFKELSHEEKVQHFESNIGSLVYKFYKIDNNTDYRTEKYGQILLDYLTDESVKLKITNEGDNIKILQDYKAFVCDVLLNIYPIEEFFLPIFEKISSDFQETDFEAILMVLTGHIASNYHSDYPERRHIFKKILPIAWVKTSNEYKKNLWMEKNDVVEHYFDMDDFSSLKILLNWKYFSPGDVIPCMVKLINTKIKSWVNEKDFDTLKEFVTKVFNPDEYYEKFMKEILKCSKNLIQNKDSELLKQFLDAVTVYKKED